MNIVKITNKIALITVIGLVYWVFIFVCSSVFGFKVFRENLTEIFFLSIFGIFAILLGSIILNVMFNLTAIAERRKNEVTRKSSFLVPSLVFLGSLIGVFLLLYLGDLATTKKKESFLVSSASELVDVHKEVVFRIADYKFSKEYLENTFRDIKLLSKIEEKFPSITVIVTDEIESKPYLLGFSGHFYVREGGEPKKEDFILSTSSDERKYLYSVFQRETSKHRFSSHNGTYEIYFPVETSQGIVVLYLSQHSRYGKIGS